MKKILFPLGRFSLILPCRYFWDIWMFESKVLLLCWKFPLRGLSLDFPYPNFSSTPSLLPIEPSISFYISLQSICFLSFLSPYWRRYLFIFMRLLVFYLDSGFDRGEICIGMISDLKKRKGFQVSQRIKGWVNKYPSESSWFCCFLYTDSYTTQLLSLFSSIYSSWIILLFFCIFNVDH